MILSIPHLHLFIFHRQQSPHIAHSDNAFPQGSASVGLFAYLIGIVQETYTFPDVHDAPFRPPLGMSVEQFVNLHSMENMLERWSEDWVHIQVVAHCFLYSPGRLLPKNGLSTLKSLASHGLQNYEFNVVATRDGHVIDHNFSPLHTVGTAGKYAEISEKDVVGKPFLIRQFKGNSFTAEVIQSNNTVLTAASLLEQAHDTVPTGTFFADCCDNDVGSFAAWLSHHSERHYTIILFYTFTITFGEQLVKEIERHAPHPEWRHRIGFVCSFYPSELERLSVLYGINAESVSALVQVGKKFLTTLADEGIPLFGLLAICSSINQRDVLDMDNKQVVRAILVQRAMVEIVEWIRTSPNFKTLKIGSLTRAYDVSLPQSGETREYFTYSLKSGELVPWPALQGLRKIKELYATPGQPELTIRPDFMITDSPERGAFPCCGVQVETSHGF